MNKREIGAEYENRAASFLQEKGMRILCRNFRCRTGEIDIIAKDGSVLVFVEVKYRSSSRNGLPEEAVSMMKQKTISRVADYYCIKNNVRSDIPCRFDVIAIEGTQIRHYKNAFLHI